MGLDNDDEIHNVYQLECIWLGESEEDPDGECVDVQGASCSSYTSSSACENDYLGLSVDGFGADECFSSESIDCIDENDPDGGIFHQFHAKGCVCEWNPTGGLDGSGGCELQQLFTSINYGEENNYSFTCSSFFDMGECVDGDQEISWTSNLDYTGTVAFNLVPQNIKDCISPSCELTGESIRKCGDELVKLPGFSVFAFITSVLLIGLFYFFKEIDSKR